MKIPDIPSIRLSDMKRSAESAFDEARKGNTGVCVLKNGKPYGVVLTSEQYENLNLEIEMLYDKLDELIVKERITETNIKVFTEKDILGDALSNVTYDDDDGWH